MSRARTATRTGVSCYRLDDPEASARAQDETFLEYAQAPGAWARDTLVFRNGKCGVIRGSVGPTEYNGRMTFGYFVRFEDGAPLVACTEDELQRLDEAPEA